MISNKLYANWLSGKIPSSVSRAAPALLLLLVLAEAAGAQVSDDDVLPPPSLVGAREFFAIYGIEQDDWASLADGEPLRDAELELVLEVLYRLPRIERRNLVQWARDTWSPENVRSDPAASRGQVLRIRGRAVEVTVWPLPQEKARRLEFEQVYRVRVVMPEGQTAEVWARQIPDVWLDGGELDEPVTAEAIMLKLGEGEAAAAPLLMAARSIAWYPERPKPRLGVSPDWVYLAALGMDVGLFDHVRSRNRKPMGVEDRECFYQLLAALRGAVPGEVRARAGRFDLGAYLQQPADQHGQLTELRGNVRRIHRVYVSDPDIESRLGLSEYFQIDLFVPLENQVVRFGEPQPGQETPTFVNSYPVTVCAASLPEGLSEGSDLNVQVRVPAAFFKLWVFRSEYVASFDERQLQLSPMFLAGAPVLIESSSSSDTALSLLLGVVFLFVLGGIWISLWRGGKSSSRALRERLQQQRPPPSQPQQD